MSAEDLFESIGADPFADKLCEMGLIQKNVLDGKLNNRERTLNDATLVLLELYQNTNEDVWMSKIIEEMKNEEILTSNRIKARFNSTPYIPVPGTEDGDLIVPNSVKNTTNIEDHIKDMLESHCRFMAWVLNVPSKKKIVLILTFDPVLAIEKQHSSAAKKASADYWKKAAIESGTLKEGDEIIPIFGLTSLHQWHNRLDKLKDNKPFSKSWVKHPVENWMQTKLEPFNLSLYSQTSSTLYFWEPSRLKGKENALKKKEITARIEQEFSRKVEFFPRLFTNNASDTKYLKYKQNNNIMGSLSKAKTLAKAWWDNTILTAYETGASDIHIEPQLSRGCIPNEATVSLRIGNDLKFSKKVPADLTPHFLVYAVEGSSIPIEETKTNKDGRRTWVHPKTEKEIDLRISVIPTIARYPKVVLRILDSDKLKQNVGELGLPPKIRETWEKAAKIDKGIVLISGPTNSGKSSTVYAFIQEIRNKNIGKSIATVEDPVEYKLPFRCSQSEIDPKGDITYKKIIKQLMRSDPDVIFLGEIRDQETCESALQLALTGHLVVSTIHANTAVETITRIKEFGMEDFVIKDTLKLIAAQRLVATPCYDCAIHPEDTTHKKANNKISREEFHKKYIPYELTQTIKEYQDVWRMQNPEVNPNGNWVSAGACPVCGYTGYMGRHALQEVITIGNKNKHHISSDDLTPITKSMEEKNLFTININAWELAWRGIIPIQEAQKINETLEEE